MYLHIVTFGKTNSGTEYRIAVAERGIITAVDKAQKIMDQTEKEFIPFHAEQTNCLLVKD